MNVKLTIKEKKTRKLTDEEKIMVDVCKFLGPKTDTKSLYNVCRDYLANRGIIFADGFIYELETPYSTTTIRDATPEEIMAYHCIKAHDECGLKVKECDTCVMNIWEYGTCGMSKLFLRSTKILKNKEVILSLTEE